MAMISLLLQLFFIILLPPPSTAKTQCIEHEKTLLLELKNQLVFNSSHSKKLVQWSDETNDDCCRWNGVACDDAGHVIGLQLDNESISGGFNESSSLFSLNYLEELDLKHNLLDDESGQIIPREIHKLTHLTSLSLSNCSLKGYVSEMLFQSPTLQILDLSFNPFLSGGIPQIPENNSFTSLNTEGFSSGLLGFLSIANNNLSGPFPTYICSFTQLQILDLSANNLSGSIPSCLFENIEDLQVLNLGRNNINGGIPDKFSPSCSLRTLDVSHNNLVGEVPLSLEKCTSLAVMNVGNNHMDGNFPCMLPSALQVLVLRSNRFHGEMRCHKTWPNLQIIDIASNNFSGYLNPFNFSSNWKGMVLDGDGDTEVERINLGVMTDFTGYYYRDEVTLTIKGLELKLVKIWPEFTSIDVSCNNFHGDIPKAIGELNSLYLLNLSHNALTGVIPKSFGKLSQLGSLDLSMNLLTGEIPHEIARLTFLVVMDVSYNKLVGKIPLGSQIQTFSADSFKGNIGLCGLPLSISCTNTSPQTHGNVGSERENIEWDYVFGAAGFAVGIGSFSWVLLFCPSFRHKYFEKIEDVYEKCKFCVCEKDLG